METSRRRTDTDVPLLAFAQVLPSRRTVRVPVRGGGQAMGHIEPLGYLLSSSYISLESFELLRLNRASNLRKIVLQLLDDWVDAETDARLAREIREWKSSEVDVEECDGFSSFEPLLDGSLSGSLRDGAKYLCAMPAEKNISIQRQSDTSPKQLGLALWVSQSHQQNPAEWKSTATARLILRRLERT